MRYLTMALLLALGSTGDPSEWISGSAGRDSNLRGLSIAALSTAPDRNVVWASGSGGVVLRSLDRGGSWEGRGVAGGETADFRGLVAWSEKLAYLISSGPGENSRIYKTDDGGSSWTVLYSDPRKEFFLDAIACISENECLALGDPIGGRFLLLHTVDGRSWRPLEPSRLPPALPGEGAFAASNSSLLFTPEKEIFFGTGGPAARLFHSADLGLSWTAAETGLAHSNPSSGIFALGWGENRTLLALGGDYRQPGNSQRTAAYSRDGGRSWQLARKPPGGYRSALARVGESAWIAVGPTGSDLSVDSGIHWRPAGSLGLNAAAVRGREVWSVGPHGAVARFALSSPRPFAVRP